MAGDAVAEVDAPRKRRGQAAGAVCQTGQETAHPSDGQPGQDRHDKIIAGAGRDAGDFLAGLDAQPAPQQGADEGLALKPAVGMGRQFRPRPGIVDEIGQFIADGCAEQATDHHGEGAGSGQRRTSVLPADAAIEHQSDGQCRPFQKIVDKMGDLRIRDHQAKPRRTACYQQGGGGSR